MAKRITDLTIQHAIKEFQQHKKAQVVELKQIIKNEIAFLKYHIVNTKGNIEFRKGAIVYLKLLYGKIDKIFPDVKKVKVEIKHLRVTEGHLDNEYDAYLCNRMRGIIEEKLCVWNKNKVTCKRCLKMLAEHHHFRQTIPKKDYYKTGLPKW